MSAVCILAPTIIAGWPVISAAVAGAAAALGLSVAREGVAAAAAVAHARQEESQRTVEVAVEDCEVLGENLAGQEQMVLAKEDLTIRVFRDARGQCRVSVKGAGRSEAELRELAEELVQKLTQIYVYDRVMNELRSRGFTVVSEEVAADETVHIHVRQQAS